jgi:hypothetical protein
MKLTKINSVILKVLPASIVLPFFAMAQVGGITPGTLATTINIPTLADTITNWVFGLILVIATVLIFYSAFLYMTSAGDEEKVKSAKNFIIYAIIGIAIAFFAKAIVAIVKSLIGA